MKFYGIIYPFRGIMILVGVEVKLSFVNLYNLRKVRKNPLSQRRFRPV